MIKTKSASALLALAALALFATHTPSHAAIEFSDITCETTTTTGTGTIDLDGVPTDPAGYLPFATTINSGATVPYHLRTGIGASRKVETGWGVFTDASPDTMTRVVSWSSDGEGQALNLSGTSTVCVGPTASLFDTYSNSDTPPSNPKDGDRWYDYGTGALVTRINDGTTSAFLETGVAASSIPFPAGSVVWVSAVSGTTCPGRTIAPNGATISKTGAYARLWGMVSVANNLVTSPTVATDGQWRDNGDGTFDLINLMDSTRNYYIRSADGTTLNVGDVQTSGLPDIDGGDIAVRPINSSASAVLGGGTGALQAPSSSTSTVGVSPIASQSYRQTLTFEASADEPIYSDSVTEVRTNNIALLPCIVL